VAYYCASLVMAEENERAEEILHAVAQDKSRSLMINLVIGHLYCTRGNHIFGIDRIISAIKDESTLNPGTWLFCKQSLMSLLKVSISGIGPILSDDFVERLMDFLLKVEAYGKNISIVETGHTISHEAEFIRSLLNSFIND
jgi:hypothetical protein